MPSASRTTAGAGSRRGQIMSPNDDQADSLSPSPMDNDEPVVIRRSSSRVSSSSGGITGRRSTGVSSSSASRRRIRRDQSSSATSDEEDFNVDQESQQRRRRGSSNRSEAAVRRPPTPVVMQTTTTTTTAQNPTTRRNSNRLSDFIVHEDNDYDCNGNVNELNGQPVAAAAADNHEQRHRVSFQDQQHHHHNHHHHDRSLNDYNCRRRIEQEPLSWYERLMPECLLSITAPITGYSGQSFHEMSYSSSANSSRNSANRYSQQELAELERQRLRRNRRIRRRLLAIFLAASLASAYFIYRGRGTITGGGLFGGFRRSGGPISGVRQTIGEMAHRFEDGLSKTYHDTLGKWDHHLWWWLLLLLSWKWWWWSSQFQLMQRPLVKRIVANANAHMLILLCLHLFSTQMYICVFVCLQSWHSIENITI